MNRSHEFIDRLVSINSNGSNGSARKKHNPGFEDSWLKQENKQLRSLNKKLIDQQCQLEEELKMLKQKDRVNEILLDNKDSPSSHLGKVLVLFYSPLVSILF